MKLFVQIPCLNEEATLPAVLASIPRRIDGVDQVEVLVIDDGSTDRTVEVARAHGVEHVVHHTRTMGLARSFRDGVHYCLAHGADIVVSTDGDNQYPQESIPDLIRPVLHGEADIAIGDRQTGTIAHFSPAKKVMQRFGSHVVNRAASTELPDAFSGFRAYSRAALYRLNIITQFSHCVETIIQAGNKRLRVASVPIVTNAKTRESRLFGHFLEHWSLSAAAIVRSYLMFKPYVLFATLATVFGVLAAIPAARFALLWLTGADTSGYVQSLLFATNMVVGMLVSLALGVLADLQRINRVLLEDQLERLKEVQYGADRTPGRRAGDGRPGSGQATPDRAGPSRLGGPGPDAR